MNSTPARSKADWIFQKQADFPELSEVLLEFAVWQDRVRTELATRIAAEALENLVKK